ncbi:hypothetical protein [Geodermatophilus normandii]|uniref:Uncharacterized protein n=1 Tax=Geodermatophilus normandii TaxID=1137989 RepID=A0A6P0GFX0_9ACTN|nr:hypothetical protein [Geodermatophilus normandii]NEM06185.1 hypothetical protein [Geodermatophilus normandii]
MYYPDDVQNLEALSVLLHRWAARSPLAVPSGSRLAATRGRPRRLAR